MICIGISKISYTPVTVELAISYAATLIDNSKCVMTAFLFKKKQ